MEIKSNYSLYLFVIFVINCCNIFINAQSCIFNNIDYSPLGVINGNYGYFSSVTDHNVLYNYYINICNLNSNCDNGNSACMYAADLDVTVTLGADNGTFIQHDNGGVTISFSSSGVYCPGSTDRQTRINLIPSNSTSGAYISGISEYPQCVYNIDITYNSSIVNFIEEGNKSSHNSSDTHISDNNNSNSCIFNNIDYSPLEIYSFEYINGNVSYYFNIDICNQDGRFTQNDNGTVTVTYSLSGDYCSGSTRNRITIINLIPSNSTSGAYISNITEYEYCTHSIDLIYNSTMVKYINGGSSNNDNSSGTQNSGSYNFDNGNNNNNSTSCIFNNIDYSPLGIYNNNHGYFYHHIAHNVSYYYFINICNQNSNCDNGDSACMYAEDLDVTVTLASIKDGTFTQNDNGSVTLSYSSTNAYCSGSTKYRQTRINLIPSNSASGAYISNITEYDYCTYSIDITYNSALVKYVNDNSNGNESSSGTDIDGHKFLICQNIDRKYQNLRTTTNLNKIECMVGLETNRTLDDSNCYINNNVDNMSNNQCLFDQETQVYTCTSNSNELSVECVGSNIKCKVDNSYCAIEDSKYFIIDGVEYSTPYEYVPLQISPSTKLISNINLIKIIVLITTIVIAIINK